MTKTLICVRSGIIGLIGASGATFRVGGQEGVWWSSRASSTNASGTVTPSAYRFIYNANGVYPSNGPIERQFGFSLRCLSTVLGIFVFV